MSTRATKKGAVKGAVAAAAGIAVLLGGAGTFALWNESGAIGAAGTTTGTLTAEFSDTTAWKDVTPGATNDIPNITDFRMVPGDVVEGTTTVDVTATGENLTVNATLDTKAAALPEGVTATVTLDDGTTTGETLVLQGTNDGAHIDLTAKVTLTFDQSAEGSEGATINLDKIKVDLQQVAPSAS